MSIDWTYTKTEYLPLTGAIYWVAVHDETGNNYVIKMTGTADNTMKVVEEPEKYYAWAPFDIFYECDLIPAPIYGRGGKQ